MKRFINLLIVFLVVSPALAYRQGVPGRDYPSYSQPPRTSFSCRGRSDGYWADVESGCGAFHICEQAGRRKHSFVCAAGTLFSQDLKVCDHWYNVECGNKDHEAEADTLSAQSHQHLDARRATPRPTTTTTSTTTTAAPFVYPSPPRYYRTTEAPQTYFDQSPFVEEQITGRNAAADLQTDPPPNDGIHSHKRTFYARDETAPIGPASSSTSRISHDSATFLSRPEEPTPRPVISRTTTDETPNDQRVSTEPVSNPMNLIESIVHFMVNGDDEDTGTPKEVNSTKSPNGLNETEPQDPQARTAEYTPDVRNERWDFEDDFAPPRPIYRPEEHRDHQEHPEDELAGNHRSRTQGNQFTTEPSSEAKHPNPWLFPETDDDLTATVAPQQSGSQSGRLTARNQHKTGNAFDFEMGLQPELISTPSTDTSTNPSRSTQRRSHLEPHPTEAEGSNFTPQQLARAPYGVLDQRGYCRCPNPNDYL